MVLVRDGLQDTVNGMESAPDKGEADCHSKFLARRERSLATIILAVEPSLLYLIGDPEDPVVVWKKLQDQENMGKQVSPAMETSFFTAERW